MFNINFKFMIEDEKLKAKINREFFSKYYLVNQNKFGTEFNGHEGCFTTQLGHMWQLNNFLKHMKEKLGVSLHPDGLELVPIWKVELHISLDWQMTKGGQQIKGDFISMVIDDESKWFIKFKDTLAANFPDGR